MSKVNPADLIDPKEQLDYYWDQVHEALAILIRASGKSLDEFVAELSKAHDKSTEPVKPMVETTRLHRVLPTVMSLWQMAEGYVDEKGEATSIRAEGEEPSLAALIQKAARHIGGIEEDIDTQEAIDLLEKAGSVERDGEMMKPLSPYFLYASKDALHPVSLIRSLAGFLGCMANTAKVDTTDRIVQSFAWTMGFPKKDLPVFCQAAREQGHQFLVDMDWHLENTDEVPNEERTFAGVGVYVYYDRD